nr:hypothetical protein [Picobirnavirus sp.]
MVEFHPIQMIKDFAEEEGKAIVQGSRAAAAFNPILATANWASGGKVQDVQDAAWKVVLPKSWEDETDWRNNSAVSNLGAIGTATLDLLPGAGLIKGAAKIGSKVKKVVNNVDTMKTGYEALKAAVNLPDDVGRVIKDAVKPKNWKRRELTYDEALRSKKYEKDIFRYRKPGEKQTSWPKTKLPRNAEVLKSATNLTDSVNALMKPVNKLAGKVHKARRDHRLKQAKENVDTWKKYGGTIDEHYRSFVRARRRKNRAKAGYYVLDPADEIAGDEVREEIKKRRR